MPCDGHEAGHAMIADATGLTLVHINRVLVNFRRRGLIELDGRRLMILNADELYRIASLT